MTVGTERVRVTATEDPLLPVPYRVIGRRAETADTVTLTLAPLAPPPAAPRPGQFTMLYAFGVGEVPISVSALAPGDGEPLLVHTLRAVGPVTKALHDAQPGQVVGVRGPYGAHWRVGEAAHGDVVVVGGGIGLAPLRPVVHEVLGDRARYGRVVVLVGARSPADLIFRDELATWREHGVEVHLTVDHPDATWREDVGFVTNLVGRARFAPASATAFVCGPEAMMRASVTALTRRGVPPAQVRVSLERNMRCGVGLCGHCQLGPILVCRDGPVLDFPTVETLLAVKEL